MDPQETMKPASKTTAEDTHHHHHHPKRKHPITEKSTTPPTTVVKKNRTTNTSTTATTTTTFPPQTKIQASASSTPSTTTTTAATAATATATTVEDPLSDEYLFLKGRGHYLYDPVLKDAPYHIRNNKNFMMTAVQNEGLNLKFASPSLQKNKEVVLTAVKQNGHALKYVPQFQNDRQVVIAAVQEDGSALVHASPDLQNDVQVVTLAVQNDDGSAHLYASPQMNKDVALVLVKHNPDNIRYIGDDLKRDSDILKAAGMYDEDHQDATLRRQQQQQQQSIIANNSKRKIVLSTRFSLNANTYSEATTFTALFKKSEYIRSSFIVYAPNANYKQTCDPDWTNFDWPCRGTKDTCKYKNKLTLDGHPTDDCCWRYSFRNQLQEANYTGGFMLQLVETGEAFGQVDDATLGMGQTIELDMANSMGVKVFQVYRPGYLGDEYRPGYVYLGNEFPFQDCNVNDVTAEISRWYKNKCQDMSVTVIHPVYRDYNPHQSYLPRYKGHL